MVLSTGDEANITIVELLDSDRDGVGTNLPTTTGTIGLVLRIGHFLRIILGIMESLAELAIVASAHTVHDVATAGVLGTVLPDHDKGMVQSTPDIDNPALVNAIAGLAKMDLGRYKEDVLDGFHVVLARMVVADLWGGTAHLSSLTEAPAPQTTVLKDSEDGRGATLNLHGLLGQTIDLDREPLDAPGRLFRRDAFLLLVGRAKVSFP